MIIEPRIPSVSRYLKLLRGKNTLLRDLQYEAIDGRILCGRILDIGGGQMFDYYRLLRINGKLESINAGPETQPTYIGDLNEALPMSDAIYDAVISLNTFEHLRRDGFALREMFRVLKPGGQFLIIVPFLHSVHGRYGDFHRHTAHWWDDFCLTHGATPGSLKVEPLVWDKWSTAASLVHGLRTRSSKTIVLLLGLWWARHRRKEYLKSTSNYALSYLIEGRKDRTGFKHLISNRS